MSPLGRLSQGHLCAVSTSDSLDRPGLGPRLKVCGKVIYYTTLIFIYQKTSVEFANLGGQQWYLAQDITDLACVSVFKVSCQQWNNVRTICGICVGFLLLASKRPSSPPWTYIVRHCWINKWMAILCLQVEVDSGFYFRVWWCPRVQKI